MFFKRLLAHRASWNALSSYIAFASIAICGIASIPIAVQFLSKEEIGSWAIINSALSYLAWMDLGVGASTGRMMADPIAIGNQKEINAWWTTIQMVLLSFALILLVVATLLLVLLLHFIEIPIHLESDFIFLFMGGSFITASSFFLRGTPGLLTAQNRFHWIPGGQAVFPWINLGFFYLFLKAGWGLRSYVFAMAIAQSCNFIYFLILTRSGPNSPRWCFKNLTCARLQRLLGYSSTVSILGLIDSLLKTAPLLLLGRFGGVALVPIYNFSNKSAEIGSYLISQTQQAFYPGWLRLYVQKEYRLLRWWHEWIGILTLGLSVIAAAGVLALNLPFITFLAGAEYYAGSSANTWFALVMVTIPLGGYFQNILVITGNLGKTWLLSPLKLIIGVSAAVIAWKHFHLPGLAAVFSLLPLFNGAYGYYWGSKMFDESDQNVSTFVALSGIVSISLTILAGYITNSISTSPIEGTLLGRPFLFPAIHDVIPALILAGIGAIYTLILGWRLWKQKSDYLHQDSYDSKKFV